MIRLASLLLLASVASASADTLESAEKALSEKFQKYTSLTADLKMTMQLGPGMSADSTGTMEFLRHDGKEKVRSEMTMKMSHGAQTMESHMLSVFDGEIAYTTNEMMGQKRVMRTNPSQVAGRPGGKAFFEDLKRDATLKLLPGAKVEDAATYVIEATSKQPGPQGPAIMKYYFDKAKGLMIKMDGLDADGKAIMTMTLSNIKVDPKLDPARFVFKPEPGTNVIDMTTKP